MDAKKAEFFNPTNHPYTEHLTYTGPGCCLCGKPREEHTEGFVPLGRTAGQTLAEQRDAALRKGL